jgi:hypothetical protein
VLGVDFIKCAKNDTVGIYATTPGTTAANITGGRAVFAYYVPQ